MLKRYIAVTNDKGEFISIHATNAITTNKAFKKIRKKLNTTLKKSNFILKEISWSDIKQLYERKKKEEKIFSYEDDLQIKLTTSSPANQQLNTSKLVEHFNNLDVNTLLNIATDLLWEYHLFTRNSFLSGSLEKNYTQYLIGVMADSIENLPYAITNTKNIHHITHKEYLINEITKYLSEIVGYFDAIKSNGDLQKGLYRLSDDIKLILSENEFFFNLLLEEQ